jgi:hypothetical protein
MSIGNLKDSGNQGNNFPWQLKMLQGLQALIDSSCCQDIIDLIGPKRRIPNVLSETGTTGTTPSGVYGLSIANVGASAGTVNGVSIPAGTTLNFDPGVLNNMLQSVSYDCTSTTFLITYLTE